MNSLRLLRDPLVLVCCSLYVVNRWLVKPHLHLDFFTCWFNDLLLIPCSLPPLLMVHEWLGLRPCGTAPTGGEEIEVEVWLHQPAIHDVERAADENKRIAQETK